MAWHFGDHLAVCIVFLVEQSVNKDTIVDYKFWLADLSRWIAAAYLEPRNLFQQSFPPFDHPLDHSKVLMKNISLRVVAKIGE